MDNRLYNNGSIDVGFDFTSDSPGYWDRFWENNDGLGGGGSDPDSANGNIGGVVKEIGKSLDELTSLHGGYMGAYILAFIPSLFFN